MDLITQEELDNLYNAGKTALLSLPKELLYLGLYVNAHALSTFILMKRKNEGA